MARLAFGFSLAALLVAATAGAAAGPKPKPVPTIGNIYILVDCLVAAKDRDLEKVLSTVPGAPESEMPWLRAAIGECLVDNRPILKGAVYARGAVAERLLYRDFPAIGAAPRHRPAAVFLPVGKDFLATATRPALAGLAMLDAASCFVRSDPAAAYSFFRTARESAEERSKITELAPRLASCLPKDEPLTISPAILRAYLAEAAYRVAAGQPQVFEGQS
ncbi:MAG TPA: hypothetical protein VF574_07625 [Allosphingosinicella sp.]|jgi:hypothetical protein